MKQNDTTNTFSKPKNINFQKENMIHKIKNIKKRKNGLKQYHDIEPLENIHNVNNDDNMKKTIVEGLTLNPIYTPEEEDWTGNDNIYEGNRKRYTKERSTSEWIQFIYDELNKYVRSFVSLILSFIAGKTIDIDDTDVTIVKDILTRILAICISSIAVINWVFVLFYRNEDDKRLYKDSKYQGKYVDISHENITNLSKDNKFYRIILWLFGKSTNVVDAIQRNIIIDVPEYEFVKNNTTITAMFIAIFLLLNQACYYFVGFLKDTLINFATFNIKEDYIYILVIVGVLGMYMLSAMDEENFNMTKFFLTEAHPVYIYIPLFLIGVCLYTAYMFIFVCPIIYLCIIGYFLSHSFLSNYFYASTLNSDKFKEELFKYIEHAKPKLNDDSTCHPFGLMDYINMFIEFVYRHLYSLTFITTLLFAIIEVNNNIKVSEIKLTLTALFGIIIVITTLLNSPNIGLFMKYVNDPKNKEFEFSTKGTSLDNISNRLIQFILFIFVIFIGIHFVGLDKDLFSLAERNKAEENTEENTEV